MMFRLKEQGEIDADITRILNNKAPWSPKRGWIRSYVIKCLSNRQIIGEHQLRCRVNGKHVPDGEPFPGYFPNVLEKHPGLFERVQKLISPNRGKSNGGRVGREINVFKRLVRCGYCGGKVHFNGTGYLVCSDGKNGKSVCRQRLPRIPAMPYYEAETAVLWQCRRLKPEQVVPSKSQQSQLCKTLRQKIERTSARLDDTRDRRANLERIIEETKDLVQQKRFLDRITKLDNEAGELQVQLAEFQREFATANQAKQSVVDWQANIETLEKLIKTDRDARMRLNAHLREFIDKIEVFPVGYPDNTDDFHEQLFGAEYDSGFRMPKANQFIAWVTAKRQTKKARFLRIHLKMSAERLAQMRKMWGDDAQPYFDVVPEGSIAGSPSIGDLWDQFKNGQKRKRVR